MFCFKGHVRALGQEHRIPLGGVALLREMGGAPDGGLSKGN